MDTTFTREIKAKNSPLLIKECSHCGSNRFYRNNKLRMNTQRKNIDVWLIYRCAKCNNTCNITLLSHTKPDLIDKVLFHNLPMDDRKAAWRHVFSAELADRNRLKTDYDSVEYEVADNFSKKDIIRMSDVIIKIQIRCEFEFNLKLSSLLRRNFFPPSTRLRRLFEQGVIPLLSGKEPQRYKVKDGDISLIDKERLLVIMGFVDSFVVKTGIDWFFITTFA